MYRLLIADDEEIERMFLHKTLEKHIGSICKIYQAKNGREALKLYNEKRIQIAILDIEMPGISGIEAAEQIRKTDPDCCIIFLTAYDEFNYAKKAITVRAMDYLLKPYQEEELLTVLEEAIHQTAKQKNREQKIEEIHEFVQNDEECSGGGQIRISKVSGNIEAFIHKYYMQDISMNQVAQAMNYSEAYFSKLFKQCFSRNFTAYLAEYRIEEAKRQLLKSTINVKNIGEAVGYPDSNYFAKVFRRYTGSSPTEYRLKMFRKQSEDQG